MCASLLGVHFHECEFLPYPLDDIIHTIKVEYKHVKQYNKTHLHKNQHLYKATQMHQLQCRRIGIRLRSKDPSINGIDNESRDDIPGTDG